MAGSNKISDKWVLIVDDMEGMRSQLRMSLTNSGFAKLHLVSSIKEALEKLAANRYDIILCDYSLGEGTDGQQFLEYLRANDLIQRNTIFIMITAEQSYAKVVAASECAPDDYLLKPFTAAQFNIRLEKLLEKQAYFAAIDRAADQKNLSRVISGCDELLAAKDKYFFDLCRIKGGALMRNNQALQAEALYREILALRPLGWARLGLAHALAALDRKAEAIALLRETLAEMPQFMAAYDFLSTLIAQSGDKKAALEVLQQAREIAPGTMSRIREVSSLAVTSGQPELAEKVMREALQKHKYSPVRKAGDYVVLSQALVDQGKTQDALGVVQEARKSFSDHDSKVALHTTESIVHHAAGNETLALAALETAMSAGDPGSLSADAVVAMADACFALGKEEDAIGLLRHTMQNHHEDQAVREKVLASLMAGGKDASEAGAMIEASVSEVIQLNNDGVRKAQAGQLGEAVELLCEAANRLPSNLQILGNAALVMALDLVNNGKDPAKLAQCMGYRESLIRQAPTHPKLEQIDHMLKRLAG
ncbi:chemotaxis protein CheY [mine drainage metagenome]|uniref:Chemotaxis protein CheY n=1 Tax=mine drainage metagenome TaxID=410659 RepID=A0A1J5QSJ9_9ZZZZ